MSQEDLFYATISALQDMESQEQRTALASQLLGKQAMELGPLFNMSSADLEAMRQQAHELTLRKSSKARSRNVRRSIRALAVVLI